MAHELLHRWQINAAHDQVAGEGVAQSVNPCELFYPGLLCNLDQLLSELQLDLPAIVVREYKTALLAEF
jgi:hypothetical protein